MKKLFLAALVIMASMGSQSFASAENPIFQAPAANHENRLGNIENAIALLAGLAVNPEGCKSPRTGFWGYWDKATYFDSEIAKAVHMFSTIVTVYTIITKMSSMFAQEEQPVQRQYQPAAQQYQQVQVPAQQGRVKRPVQAVA